MKSIIHKTSLSPTYSARNMLDIDFEKLYRDGIRHVAFDADNTLVPYFHNVIEPKTIMFLLEELKKFDSVCIASNRVTLSLIPLGKSLGGEVVQAGLILRKPHKKYFKKVLQTLNARPEQTVMIGDKLVADIWGANRMGLASLWVKKLGNDHILDRIFLTRVFERILARMFV